MRLSWYFDEEGPFALKCVPKGLFYFGTLFVFFLSFVLRFGSGQKTNRTELTGIPEGARVSFEARLALYFRLSEQPAAVLLSLEGPSSPSGFSRRWRRSQSFRYRPQHTILCF